MQWTSVMVIYLANIPQAKMAYLETILMYFTLVEWPNTQVNTIIKNQKVKILSKIIKNKV